MVVPKVRRSSLYARTQMRHVRIQEANAVVHIRM